MSEVQLKLISFEHRNDLAQNVAKRLQNYSIARRLPARRHSMTEIISNRYENKDPGTSNSQERPGESGELGAYCRGSNSHLTIPIYQSIGDLSTRFKNEITTIANEIEQINIENQDTP